MAKSFFYLISFLSVLFLLIIIFLIRESKLTTTTVKDITIISCSFFTLILAILLYDRFDYRKVIFQKKLSVILDLLVDIKSFTFFAQYTNDSGQHNMVFQIDRNSLENQLKYKHLNTVISFNENYHKRLYTKITPYINNPFLPKKIAESLQFLYMLNNNSINHISNIEVSRIFFSDEIPIELDQIWYIESSNTVVLKSYIENYIICLNIIEDWINKHSNIKVDLNI